MPHENETIEAGDLFETAHFIGEPRQYRADSVDPYGVWIRGGSGIVGSGYRRVPHERCTLLEKAQPKPEA